MPSPMAFTPTNKHLAGVSPGSDVNFTSESHSLKFSSKFDKFVNARAVVLLRFRDVQQTA